MNTLKVTEIVYFKRINIMVYEFISIKKKKKNLPHPIPKKHNDKPQMS